MQTATGAHWAGTDVVGRAAHAVVSGLPMGRRRSRVAPKSGAHARVARLRQRLGGGDSRKMVGGGVSRRYLHSTLLISSDLALHAHSARRTSKTRVILVAPVEWRARGPAVKSQGGSQGGGRSDGVAKLTFDSAEMALWPAVTRWRGCYPPVGLEPGREQGQTTPQALCVRRPSATQRRAGVCG